jgi:hypothetical protein
MIHLWDNNEYSKTFQIDIPGQRQIETSIDVFLEEEITFQRYKESRMEIDSETIPSPPSAAQRETNIILADPVSPVLDMSRDIGVWNKRHAQAHSAGGRETYKPLKAHPEKTKRFFELLFSHEPHH